MAQILDEHVIRHPQTDEFLFAVIWDYDDNEEGYTVDVQSDDTACSTPFGHGEAAYRLSRFTFEALVNCSNAKALDSNYKDEIFWDLFNKEWEDSWFYLEECDGYDSDYEVTSTYGEAEKLFNFIKKWR